MLKVANFFRKTHVKGVFTTGPYSNMKSQGKRLICIGKDAWAHIAFGDSIRSIQRRLENTFNFSIAELLKMD